MTFFTDSWPTARKEHRCSLCARVIRSGEKYRRGVGIDGTAWTFKECLHCRAVMDLADPTGGEYEYGPDTFAEWEPTNITEARWRAQWKRRWQKRDGSLYPVPTEGVTP